MKSASKNWIFLFITLFLFNCGSNKPQPVDDSKPMGKAYVLLRTEGSENDITQLKDILNSDFVTNNVASDIITYPLERDWNNSEIFSTAYNDNYDYIVLIDQVAKFTIDNRTQIGGKYQIRSYHIKSPDPDWIDLGQKTCNITVKPSIKKFTQQIVSNIVPNYRSSLDTDKIYADNTSNSSSSEYDKFKTSKEVDNDIEELKKQLREEKEKTKKALEDKELLEKKYEVALAIEKQKSISALEEIKKTKKAEIIRLERQSELIRQRQKQKEIAESIAAKKEEIRKKEAEEALKNPPIVASVIKEPTREERLKKGLKQKNVLQKKES